jgi:hypothetical protein
MLVDNFDQIIGNLHDFNLGKITADFKLEIKGLDFIRRDWCGLTKQSGRKLLLLMLNHPTNDSEQIKDDVYSYLANLSKRMTENKVPLKSYIIYKMLKKPPSKYKDMAAQPHVMVAHRLIRNKHRTLDQLLNHSIPYIICGGKEGLSAGERAYHYEEVANKENNLHVDVQYYTNGQISGPISRIIKYLEGINMEKVATLIGAEKKNLESMAAGGDDEAEKEARFFNVDEKKIYGKLKWCCFRCKKENVLKSSSLFKCDGCGHFLSEVEVRNLSSKYLSTKIGEYYSSQRTCEECQEEQPSDEGFSMVNQCSSCDSLNQITENYGAIGLFEDLSIVEQFYKSLRKKSFNEANSAIADKLYNWMIKNKTIKNSSFHRVDLNSSQSANKSSFKAAPTRRRRLYKLLRAKN